VAVRAGLMREGILSRPSGRTWQWDAEQGANTLTIAAGHTIDAMRFVAGDPERLCATLTTQVNQWFVTDTKTFVDVTSPDNILAVGRLKSGAVASVHVGAIPYAGSGYRMEVYGREGTLVVSGEDSPQMTELVLHGAKGNDTLAPIAVPEDLTWTAPATPAGVPTNVGQMYALFARAIRGGGSAQPTFDIAVDLHRLLDGIRQASADGRAVTVG
jgi:predicted dehydrogenase